MRMVTHKAAAYTVCSSQGYSHTWIQSHGVGWGDASYALSGMVTPDTTPQGTYKKRNYHLEAQSLMGTGSHGQGEF